MWNSMQLTHALFLLLNIAKYHFIWLDSLSTTVALGLSIARQLTWFIAAHVQLEQFMEWAAKHGLQGQFAEMMVYLHGLVFSKHAYMTVTVNAKPLITDIYASKHELQLIP